MTQSTPTSRLIISGFLLLLFVSAWAFYPGLGGELLFDDIPNFKPWADLGDINSPSQVLTFIFSGLHPPGRPLSLLSFLIDDQSWPADIFSLKRTNLALHQINTCLIFWLCLKTLERLLPSKDTKTQAILALFAAAVWSLHPLQVSNVSYIIQRMNLLSTTLELAGLLLFFYGREQLAQSPRKAFILCSMAIGLFMPLAILAKENGLLLCVFALLVENFCFRSMTPKWWRYWKLFFLWAPLTLFVLYCLKTYNGFTTGFEIRNFNAWERLLTQGPVLTDYLSQLLLPRLQGSGLYHDNFPVSRSLLSPISTLFSWATLLALLLIATVLRKRQPLISFGVFFYFCGHLLESTILPLELYYEHRNYLPQIGLWLALAGLLSITPQQTLRRPLLAACIFGLALLVALTRSNAALWSQPDLQAAVWHHDNPGSQRNSISYANTLIKNSDFIAAEKVLTAGSRANPNSLALLVGQRFIRCYPQDIPTRFDDLPKFAEQADFDNASIIMLEKMRTEFTPQTNSQTKPPQKQRGCIHPTDAQIADIYKGLLKNKRYLASASHAKILEYLAEIAAAHGDPMSLHYYDQAFIAEANPVYPYRQALLLEQHGQHQYALLYAVLAKKSLTKRYRMRYPDLLPRIEQLQVKLAPPATSTQP